MVFTSVLPIMTLRSVMETCLLEEHNVHEQSFLGVNTSRPCLIFSFPHAGRWSWVDTTLSLKW